MGIYETIFQKPLPVLDKQGNGNYCAEKNCLVKSTLPLTQKTTMQPLIGQISLNTSFFIYVIWLLPQILLNFKRKDTEGLSMLMHGILYLGFLTDLMYGFGREMQWQYRAVTIIGLLSLTVQHYQFFRYGLHNAKQKMMFHILSIFCLSLLMYVISTIRSNHTSQQFYDAAGMISNACWLSYMLPQIIKNHLNRSTVGLSLAFIFLSMFLEVCDFTSAWMLGWDYPSKVGPLVTFIGNLILFFQITYYAKKDKKFSKSKLASDS
jgi:uncharacterized protein with PQ loop repeat